MRVVVITGASSGIGAAFARELSKRGDKLVLAARHREALDAAAKECDDALAVPTDVTKRAQVEHLRDAAIERFGHVDAWINNAGQGIHQMPLALTDEDVDAMMAVNLKGPLYGAQAIVPHFRARGKGHLVNVSSFLGRVPITLHRSAYNAAKAALNALTANLRMELAQTDPGIHVSLVMPSVVATAFPTSVLHGGEGPWTAGQKLGPHVTVQSAEDVARQVADLLDGPRAELYTTPHQHEMAVRYFSDVAGFEAQRRG
ncbi:MAG: hypothetical protein QOE90_1360 [Thermoplasmata archaeon]|jgi:short-subunit dehydrogenase|nr:hypothetical protein [Thermoplasmata archaeon]